MLHYWNHSLAQLYAQHSTWITSAVWIMSDQQQTLDVIFQRTASSVNTGPHTAHERFREYRASRSYMRAHSVNDASSPPSMLHEGAGKAPIDSYASHCVSPTQKKTKWRPN